MATGIPRKQRNGKKPPARTHEPEVKLDYAGKLPEDIVLHQEPAQVSLLWSGVATNRLYFGDNLPILAHLVSEPTIQGNVRLIYIDPPFATNSVFQSRTLTDAYQDLLVGAHYIEFLRQRLILLRELLADDGSIYVHLDDNMAFHIKVVMDEIFGQKYFRNWITRRKCSHKNYTRKKYGNISDYILFYTKTDHYVWNRPLEDWSPERARKEYPCTEEKTGRRYKKVPVHAPGVRNGATGQIWRGKSPPLGKHWQYTPKQLDEIDARGEIYWSPSGNPRRKIYLEQSAGVPIQDIWLDFRDTRNQNVRTTGYPTEKNTDMMAQIIYASSNPGDIVLDGFSGSGTTLAVASQLGRKWVGIDNSQEAIQATLKRFAQGAERMGDFVHSRSETGQDPDQVRINDFCLYVDASCTYDDVLSDWCEYLALLEK